MEAHAIRHYAKNRLLGAFTVVQSALAWAANGDILERTSIAIDTLRFVDRLPRSVPILLVHGTADWRVDPRDSMDMAQALFVSRRPFRLLLIEGADHAISERRDEYYLAARDWIDRFVRDRAPLPELKPHGA